MNAILDGDFCPQTKHDAFKRRYDSTMSRINSYYCWQSAMKLASKPVDALTAEEKKKLELFDKEAKYLESSSRMQVPTDFKDQLEEALIQISAFTIDGESGGYVSQEIIKAQFEVDYMIAHRFRSGECDIIYSTNSDMSTLCGPNCLSICSFGGNKKRKHGNDNCVRNSYNISGSSNMLMESFQRFVGNNFPANKIKFEKARYPLLEHTHH